MNGQIKALVLDVDGTLNKASQPISIEVSQMLMKCLSEIQVCILTSRKFSQIEHCILNRLYGVTEKELLNLHLYLAQGTQCYDYDIEDHCWKLKHEYPLTEAETEKIRQVIKGIAEENDLWHPEQLGNGDEYFECAKTQVTFSGLGVKSIGKDKLNWDPDFMKRKKIIERAQEIAPEFSYKIGGLTSIDITILGMDKYFGMTQILRHLGISESEVIYLGDEMNPNGNDYPIVRSGDFSFRPVSGPAETLIYLRGFCDAKR